MQGVVARKLRTGLQKARIIAQEDGRLAGILSICAEGLSMLGMHALDRFRWPEASARWERAFDRRLAFDTSTMHRVSDLGVDSAIAADANRYEATSAMEFKMVMSMIDLDPRDYLFVDYGSGKGRVMLMAAQYPFAMVRGVEASRDLHAISVRNALTFLETGPACRDVAPILTDAAAWQPERTPFLAFLYNPFTGDTLRKVLANIAAAATSGKPCYLAYINPTCRNMLDKAGSFLLEKTAFGDYVLLYRIIPGKT